MTLVYVLNTMLTEGGNVLITASTNVAVDRILLGLLELGFDQFVRIGSVRRINKKILPYAQHQNDTDGDDDNDTVMQLKSMLNDRNITAQDRDDITAAIQLREQRISNKSSETADCCVLGATIASTAFNSLRGRTFDIIILDECSQVTEPSALVPILKFNPKRLVLVGDPMQLAPPLARNCVSKNSLERTLFERLADAGHVPIMLKTQYRLHPTLSALPNKLFYNGAIIDGVTAVQPVLPGLPILTFVDVPEGHDQTSGMSKSMENAQEASIVVSIVSYLIKSGVPADSIGVICLYRAQVAVIRKKISDEGVLVATVDSFQGGMYCVLCDNTTRREGYNYIVLCEDQDQR